MKFKIVKLNTISEKWGEDESDFYVKVHAEVVEDGAPGGEAFSVDIISPKALESDLPPGEQFASELGRGYLIVNDYNKPKIIESLQRMIAGSGANNWEELSTYVEKYFDWIE